MSIEFGCCECRKLLRVPESSAGKKARCPACGSIQDVPGGSTTTALRSFEHAPNKSQPPTIPSDSPFASPTLTNPFTDGASSPSGNPFAMDTTNPYAAPTSGSELAHQGLFRPGTRVWARTCVEGPANSLAAVGGLVLVLSAIGFATSLASVLPNGDVEDILLTVLGTIVSVLPYGIVLYGAHRMKQLENYRLAVAASILAMLPCSGCCILGLPVGIWSLVVLCNPEIRAAIR